MQASCLMRDVGKGGQVAGTPAQLPPILAGLIGQPVGSLKARLDNYLTIYNLRAPDVAGALDTPVSRAYDGSPTAPLAQYFVIHDTSSPWLGDAPFPLNSDPAVNQLGGYAGPNAVAHIFVNRIGQTLTGHDFSVPWRASLPFMLPWMKA